MSTDIIPPGGAPVAHATACTKHMNERAYGSQMVHCGGCMRVRVGNEQHALDLRVTCLYGYKREGLWQIKINRGFAR